MIEEIKAADTNRRGAVLVGKGWEQQLRGAKAEENLWNRNCSCAGLLSEQVVGKQPSTPEQTFWKPKLIPKWDLRFYERQKLIRYRDWGFSLATVLNLQWFVGETECGKASVLFMTIKEQGRSAGRPSRACICLGAGKKKGSCVCSARLHKHLLYPTNPAIAFSRCPDSCLVWVEPCNNLCEGHRAVTSQDIRWCFFFCKYSDVFMRGTW